MISQASAGNTTKTDGTTLGRVEPESAKARVLMVSHTGFLGGAERSLLELAVALRSDDRCVLRLACPSGPLADAAMQEGIPVVMVSASRLPIRWRAWCYLSQFIRFQLPFLRCLRSYRPDILHLNGLRSSVLALPLARALRIACLWHVRDDPAGSRIVPLIAHRVDAVVAASRFIADRLTRELGSRPRDLTVVPNGVREPALAPEDILRARSELCPSPNARVVTMVAQLVPWKRHDLFLEAAATLAPENPALHFAVVGSNPWLEGADYLQRLVRRAEQPDLRGRVAFLGQRQDAQALIAASDVLALPSDNEPFGRVIVEAWWLGTPVVVTDSGGPAELVESGFNGVHFEAGNAESLARALACALSENKFRCHLATIGRECAEAYVPTKTVQGFVALYESLLSQRERMTVYRKG